MAVPARPSDSAPQWGPFKHDLDPAERLASMRCLRALCRLLVHPDHSIHVLLTHAERDPAAMPVAAAAFDALPSLPRRRVLATFAALHRGAAA